MSLRIIIPVKPFEEAKQRLAVVLSEPQRAALAQRLFQHVFATALHSTDARSVIVVTRSAKIVDFANARGAAGLVESGSPDLNAALSQAAEFARANGASRLLVVAGDLPLLGEDDLALMSKEDCAIAPDRHRRGTNALMWPANPAPSFAFGENSFERHRDAAKSVALDPKIITSPGLAHDVDVPDDLLAESLS